MAETRRYSLDAQLDITQILSEAQHRWLRPTEICEILQNYKKFRIAAEPPDRPPSGSLFLFDRKVLRYFRKDGHNWRKKKDGKTVKEAHERLKAGSVDVLHCYYAHGEDNENFQRRSYWMLEEELSHIVLVHYREVKGTRANFNRSRESNSVPNSCQTEEDVANYEAVSSSGSKFQQYDHQGVSQVTDTTSFNSTQASEHEDAESAYRNQASPGVQSNLDSRSSEMLVGVGSVPYYSAPLSSNNYQGRLSAPSVMNFGLLTHGEINKNPIDNGLVSELHQDLELPGWENTAESGKFGGYQSGNIWTSLPSSQSSATSMVPGHKIDIPDQDLTARFQENHGFGHQADAFEEWKAADPDASHLLKWPKNQKSDNDLNFVQNAYYASSAQPLFHHLTTQLNDAHQEEFVHSLGFSNAYTTEQSSRHVDFQADLVAEGSPLQSGSEGNLTVDDKNNHPAIRQPLLEVMRGGLKKFDSFDRWVSKELGDVKEPTMMPGSAMYWETVGNEVGDGSNTSNQVPLDNYMLSPSLSQDQLFSIIDFSPNCSFTGSEIKVLIMGRFLRSREEVTKHKWACMFGEIEVPAEIISDGVLRCHTPMHGSGRVPFYVTCSNRLACSEVREFEFLPNPAGDIACGDLENSTSDESLLHMRFGKLLALGTSPPLTTTVQNSTVETSQLCNKISLLLNDDPEWEQMLNPIKQDEYSADNVKDQLLQKLLKEKLYHWLLRKIAEDGKGASVLDEGGQGVLHFAAALGYHWAIPPTIAAGVSVNFRDVNGWTALHWAAFYGREGTVAFLISLGAATGIVTDPTPEYPSGRTPADLAASNGHKGIAGYLAESALSSHLTSLELKESKESDNRNKAIGTVPVQVATPFGDGYTPHGSLKDPLAAVRNATQAAARIHQVYRVQSFQRKQIKEYGDTEYGISAERALSLVALKAKKAGHDEPVHSAAVRIQNKFRSWKGRREYLLIRQRIIKIQAHVRGHQVRKNYRKIIWTVGILDKVILRWRRKRRGLSGFKREALKANTSATGKETEDEYDHLKDGRKQSEERLKKAVARVQSMVRYPEARAQYHRLMNVVSDMQDAKTAYEKILSDQDADFDDLINLDALLEDDSFMDMAI